MILCFFMGTGTQIFTVLYVFLFSMCLGLVNQWLRWSWVISLFIIIAMSGWFNGFVTARWMKAYGLSDWIGGATVAAMVYPTTTLICLALVDVIEWLERSSAAFPLTSCLLYGVVWMTISICFCYHGATIGYRHSIDTTRQPKINTLKKNIPQQPWFMRKRVLMPIFGAIMFASIFVEF
jgi:transmembrane 9 superfamily protein 2/4